MAGNKAFETVCVNSDTSTCVTDYEFLEVNSQSGLQSEYDGYVGMVSGKSGDTGALLVPTLFEQGVISENKFSFYLTNDYDLIDCPSCQSYIDFGTPDASIIGVQTIVWLPVVEDDKWWTNYISGFRWGNDDPNLYKLETKKVFTDTGTSCLIGPSLELGWVKSNLLNMVSQYYTNGEWGQVFSCSEIATLPSLFFLIGNYWFEVMPKDYIVAVDTRGQCAFCLTEDDTSDYWIMGSAFLRGFYSIYDYDTY
jgi:hypothetical protein